MAFGKGKQDDEDTGGRFFVDHVPVMVSGKKFLQLALDKGDANGWELRWIENSDKHGWILVVWDRSPKS